MRVYSPQLRCIWTPERVAHARSPPARCGKPTSSRESSCTLIQVLVISRLYCPSFCARKFLYVNPRARDIFFYGPSYHVPTKTPVTDVPPRSSSRSRDAFCETTMWQASQWFCWLFFALFSRCFVFQICSWRYDWYQLSWSTDLSLICCILQKCRPHTDQLSRETEGSSVKNKRNKVTS